MSLRNSSVLEAEELGMLVFPFEFMISRTSLLSVSGFQGIHSRGSAGSCGSGHPFVGHVVLAEIGTGCWSWGLWGL